MYMSIEALSVNPMYMPIKVLTLLKYQLKCEHY